MEFKATVIQTVIHGKAYTQGQELDLKDVEPTILNILNLKRALCFFKKVGNEWIRSNFFEYIAHLRNKTIDAVKKVDATIEKIEEVITEPVEKKRGRPAKKEDK